MKYCTFSNISLIFVCSIAFFGLLYAAEETAKLLDHKNITEITFGKDVEVFTAHTMTIAVLFLCVIILTCKTHILAKRLRQVQLTPQLYESMTN